MDKAGQASRGEQQRIKRIKVDLHIHTCHSPDALTTPEEVVAAALRRNIGALAITDHDRISGALEVQRMAPFPVIIGEEIYTTDGEVIGLFLSELIPPGLTATQTVDRIREQGGLVYIPHPFDTLRASALGEEALLSILEAVDAIEVLNARVIQPADNERARAFAKAHGIAQGAGSDAHSALEIGQAYVEMEPFADRDTFMYNLSRCRVGGSVSWPHVHLFSTWAKMQRRIGS